MQKRYLAEPIEAALAKKMVLSSPPKVSALLQP
jgi:hypothetical protein